jgi:hypothetical protein
VGLRTPPRSLHQSMVHVPLLNHTLTLNHSQVFEEMAKEKDGGEQTVRQEANRQFISPPTTISLNPYSPKQEAIPTQKDHWTRFYERYHKVAEEYDNEFLKKHDEDLNTTLIFVSPTWALVGSS